MSLYRHKTTGELVKIVRFNDEHVFFFPQGGGFERSCARPVFDRDFELVRSLPYRRGTVTADWWDYPALPCWTDGTRSSCGSMPWFAKEQAERLVAMPELNLSQTGQTVTWDNGDDEPTIYVPKMIDGQLAWPIGAGDWSWDSVEFEGDRNEDD